MLIDGDYTTEVVTLASGLGSVGGVLGLISAIMASVLVTFVYAQTVRKIRIWRQVLTSWLLSAVALVALLQIYPQLHDDGPTWHGLAVTVSEFLQGISDDTEGLREGRAGYSWITGMLYAALGHSPALLIVLNFLAQAILIITISKITIRFAVSIGSADQRIKMASSAAWILALTPSIFIWVPQILRETIASSIVSLALLGAIAWLQDRRGRYILLTVVSLGLLFWIRATMASGVIAAFVAAAIMVTPLRTKYSAGIRMGVGGILFAGVLAIIPRLGVSQSLTLESRATDLSYLARTATTAYVDNAGVYSSDPYMAVATVNLPRTIFGPFPWELDASPGMVLALLEAVTWWGAIGITGLWLFRRKSSAISEESNNGILKVLMIVAAGLLLVCAVGISNYGMLSRIRPAAYVCLVPIISSFCVGRSEKLKARSNSNKNKRRTTQPKPETELIA